MSEKDLADRKEKREQSTMQQDIKGGMAPKPANSAGRPSTPSLMNPNGSDMIERVGAGAAKLLNKGYEARGKGLELLHSARLEGMKTAKDRLAAATAPFGALTAGVGKFAKGFGKEMFPGLVGPEGGTFQKPGVSAAAVDIANDPMSVLRQQSTGTVAPPLAAAPPAATGTNTGDKPLDVPFSLSGLEGPPEESDFRGPGNFGSFALPQLQPRPEDKFSQFGASPGPVIDPNKGGALGNLLAGTPQFGRGRGVLEDSGEAGQRRQLSLSMQRLATNRREKFGDRQAQERDLAIISAITGMQKDKAQAAAAAGKLELDASKFAAEQGLAREKLGFEKDKFGKELGFKEDKAKAEFAKAAAELKLDKAKFEQDKFQFKTIKTTDGFQTEEKAVVFDQNTGDVVPVEEFKNRMIQMSQFSGRSREDFQEAQGRVQEFLAQGNMNAAQNVINAFGGVGFAPEEFVRLPAGLLKGEDDG